MEVQKNEIVRYVQNVTKRLTKKEKHNGKVITGKGKKNTTRLLLFTMTITRNSIATTSNVGTVNIVLSLLL